MRDPAPPSALAALPLPSGDPSGLWRAAGWLRLAAGHVESTPLVSTRALPAEQVGAWSGSAALEADSEAAIIGSRSASLADRLSRAAAVLSEYGDALDAAQRVTVGLQTADVDTAGAPAPANISATHSATHSVGWADPAGGAVLAGRYAVAMADLDLAGAVAAHRLRGLATEVGEGPVGRGGQRTGSSWAVGAMGAVDPAPRAAALAGLTLVAGAQHRSAADRTADEVVEALTSVSAGDAWAVGAATTLLDGWAGDPVFAQALWARLPPDALALALAAVTTPSEVEERPQAVSAEWRESRGAALVRALGCALAVAANPVHAQGLDPASAARLDRWRPGWLGALAGQVAEVVRRPDGTTVGGAWVQGQLLAAATAAGFAPGAAYATTVGVAIVRADIQTGSSSGRGPATPSSPTALLTPDGRSLATPGLRADPVLALTEALLSDRAAARAWLLHPLPGAPDRLVVDHLVDTRYLDLDPAAGALALCAVGRLVVAAGSDPASRDATLATAAFLDAVGRTALASPQPAVFRRVLSPALGDLGSLLGAHADALTATLDDSAAPGIDAADVRPTDRLVRHGRRAGTWEVVLADRARAAALLGALALDGSTAPTARDPGSGPAPSRAMSGIAGTLEGDLEAAVARSSSGAGDIGATEAAAHRLGSTTGFVLTSAGEALARQDADRDADHERLAGLADLAIGKLTVPGAAGRLATPLVRAAADQLVATTLPTDAETAQRSTTSAAVAQRRDDALTAVRALVSRARPWTPEQSPSRWAARTAASRSPATFWSAEGIPLPEAEMTTAQRRSFTDWRHDEGLDVYDTVPQVVRDAVDAGVRDAGSARGPEIQR